MKTENKHTLTATRGVCYKILSESFSSPEGLELRNIKILYDEMEKVDREAALAVEKMKESYQATGSRSELMVDHARLFIGPFSLLSPPFGSFYLDQEKRVMGDSTLSVNDLYMKFGLTVASDFHSTPDHISAELEFMYYLTAKELDAVEAKDKESSARILESQKLFLNRYLAPWIPEFTLDLEQNAQTPFYRNFGVALRRFVEREHRYLSGDIP
ncbi:MAG: molecular chaperone TorD family protein [Thermodesulfobacteriota bacterium]